MEARLIAVLFRCLIVIAGIISMGAPVDRVIAAQLDQTSNIQKTYEALIADARAAMLIDPDVARAKAVEAERQAKAIAAPSARGIAVATAKWLQGESFLRANKAPQANMPIAEALEIAVKLTPQSKLHADILFSRGGVESDQGRAANALRDYQSAYRIYARLHDARGQAIALLFISMIYNDGLDQVSALKYSKQALEVYNADPNLSISIYNNTGVVLSQLKKYNEAVAQYDAAIGIANKIGGKALRARILNNIARARLSSGNVALADAAIKRGLAIANDREIAGPRSKLVATAAQSALQRGDMRAAVTLIESALVGVDPTTTGMAFKDIHQTAYDVFSKVGDSKRALVHLQALKRIDDDATRLATSTKTALMAARFDFANQELKISQLKADELRRSVAFERARARTQRYVFFGLAAAVAIVIALLAIGLFTIRRSRDQVRAANAGLAITNSALGKALAAKTEFLATTSHEIRTPLNGILGMTEVMLADSKIAPLLRDRLGVVHGAGLTMRALVDDILDVAKMETGNLTIEAAPFDLCATVMDATRMWEEQARGKGLAFAVDLKGCPTIIVGDAARIRQIVFNLLSNALKFTKQGRVTLAIDVGDDERLRVAVTDSGIGIPADKLEQIFESFAQADAGTTRQFGGTGLGLAICRNLARAMGGDVTVASVEGQGATFTLVLPFVRAAEAAVSAPEAPDPAGAITLVVDRNPITRSMFRALLAPHAGTVAFAGSVDEALAQLRDGNVARVLIDDATIRLDGTVHADLVRIVEAIDRASTETFILWPISAPQERDELLATGITRVVAKPVSGAALIRAIFADPAGRNETNHVLVSDAA